MYLHSTPSFKKRNRIQDLQYRVIDEMEVISTKNIFHTYAIKLQKLVIFISQKEFMHVAEDTQRCADVPGFGVEATQTDVCLGVLRKIFQNRQISKRFGRNKLK